MLKFLVIILLIIGIFFRFTNLDRKVYSYDEAITSLRISGYTWTEMVKQDFQGKLISVADLQRKYQQINPDKSLIDTIKGLATEEPQLPPLYFTLARFWVKLFGSTIAVTRSLSALISLLIFPSIYWLCLELFESSLVAWIAIAIISVSPFHILYAQDARPYMLLAVTILLSSGALLRAIRLNTKTTWIIYAATLPLGLYCHLLFTLVAAAHSIYVILTEKFRFNHKIRAYLVVSTAGILTFIPWILVLIINVHEVDETVGLPRPSMSIFSSFNLWILIFSRIFIDTHWAGGVVKFDSNKIVTDLIRMVAIALLLLMITYSIYFLCRHTPRRIWLFILTLIGITVIVLVGVGGVGDRYIVACVLGIQLAVAHLLAAKITSAGNIQQQKLWQIALIAVISSGIISCAVSSQTQLWWNKYPSSTKYNPAAANIINQSPKPLIISHGGNNLTGKILSFSYLLKPQVQLQLAIKPNQIKIPDGFSDIFLYRPTEALRSHLEKEHNYQITPISKTCNSWLWIVKK